jgi:hypothetical protein
MCFVASVSAANRGYTLLVARVASAKYVGDASSVDDASWHPVFVDRCSVRVRDVRVVEGDYAPGASMKFELLDYAQPGRHARQFRRTSEIYLAVRLDPGGKPIVEDWRPVVRIACLYDTDLERYGLGESFTSDYQRAFGGASTCAQLE